VAEYSKGEARSWARERMQGVCGCLLPTFNSSLTKINEEAIRHDVRHEKDLGFWGSLLVSECGTTKDEMRQVMDVAVDEGQRVGLRTMLLASFPTLDDTIEMVQYAEHAGVDLTLLAYPLTFCPQSEREIYEFTKAVCDSTNLGIMLFAIHLWGFDRIHPTGFSPQLIGELIGDCENVVAIKNEIGQPGVGGVAEVFHRFKDSIVVSDPYEKNSPAWINAFGMQFMGTANYEYYGGAVPTYFQLLQDGKFDEGMEEFWRIHPARKASDKTASEYLPGARLVHRTLWKYQYWLNGFNGGPIRQPQMRINPGQMETLRRGLEASGITPAPGSDANFFVGRNPQD
jgi:dihydrodipicolinate synthase/N-acetylneuraminate lyase